ncbi:helix-hairpin-helix domain-containing protein [Methylosinus sp. Sm6]|nr:helix-hairpin-helix domain-containing protein [Methylosinus sp. Sm6]
MKPNAILAIAMFAAATPALAETTTPPAAKPGNLVVAPALGKHEAATTLDINTATVEQLAAAKGLDRLLAEAIVKGRPYKATSELVKHKILSDAQFAAVKDALVVKQN